MEPPVVTLLKERNFIRDLTPHFPEGGRVYVGFDPTADSLHVGNLVAMMGLAWFQRFGYEVVALVGGATGMIGDPSGKSSERNLLTLDQVHANAQGIARSLRQILRDPIQFVNNHDWLSTMSCLAFLRDVGKSFRLGSMLSKDSVRQRVQSENGMSFTEFSYQILQAYDFLYLHDHFGVSIQIGGSDQWGNITGGIDLVRRERGATVHGMTFPLLMRSDGKKFGKSEEGTLWLDRSKVSAYDFYQYFYRMPDADLSTLLRWLTFLDLGEIEELEQSMQRPGYVPNTVQQRCAEEITRIVHGEEGLQEAQRVTDLARPGKSISLSPQVLESLSHTLPHAKIPRGEVIGRPWIELYQRAGLVETKGEAKRLVLNGGLSVNEHVLTDPMTCLEEKDLIGDRYLLLQVGKKKRAVVILTP